MDTTYLCRDLAATTVSLPEQCVSEFDGGQGTLVTTVFMLHVLHLIARLRGALLSPKMDLPEAIQGLTFEREMQQGSGGQAGLQEVGAIRRQA